MAIFKNLFNKKKSSADTDGQEEFFKEDFPPVIHRPSTKKAEEPKKNSSDKTDDKPAVKATKSATKAADKPGVKATKSATKATDKPAVKATKSATKAADKPAVKATKSATKATDKPAVKATKSATKAADKPAVKATKSTAKGATAKATTKKTTTKASTKELTDDSPEVRDAVAIQESKPSANGKWDIRRAKDGRFFFSLYASNHTIIAYSQIYSSQTAVTTGINSVIANAAKAETEDTTLKKSSAIPCPKWEIYLDKAEQYRFRLYAPNGLCICHSSHGYATKGGCKGGIESIKKFASDEASINKTYLKKD